MGILSWTDKIFIPKSMPKEFSFDRYLHELDSGQFRDRYVFGVLENEVKIQKVDMSKSPNALYVGSMGSGKSKGAVFSIITWMLANSDQTVLFIVDPMKGANDYASLMEKDSKDRKKYKQIYPVLSSEQGVIRLIDMLYDEAMSRREKFNEVQAESFLDYEKKTGKKVARVITLMEEFHAIPYAIMNFYPDFKVDLTTANKFHTLMRIGRSYGIWFVACTQKSTKSDIPTEMVPNFVNKNVFKVTRGEATYLLGDTKAAEITPEQKGRCVTEYGPAQFPLFEDKETDTERKLLKKYVKPLEAECFYLNDAIILDVLSGKSTKDQYKHKKLTDLIKGIESYNAELVITLLHEKQGHRVEQLDSTINNFGISHIVYWNNDIKVAVMTRCHANGRKITGKHIGRLKKAMDFNECTHGVIYTSATDLPNTLYKISNELGIEVVDHDDMFKAAYKVESEGEKAGLNPDKLADDDKESGKYQISVSSSQEDDDDDYSAGSVDDYEISPNPNIENEDDDVVIDLGRIEDEKNQLKENEKNVKLESLKKEDQDEYDGEFDDLDQIRKEALGEIEEPDSETIDEVLEELKNESLVKESTDNKNLTNDIILSSKPVNRVLKREKVTKVCTIRKDDTPSLLFHAMKTEESQEIYRVLFFILDNMQIKHKYFLDKKISKNLTFKEKQQLGVTSVDDWNALKETLSDDQFDQEFLNYLENFAPCAFPVHSICWQEDELFLKKYLKMCDYMNGNSTIIEKYTSAFFNNKESRSQLIQKMGIKKPKIGLFNPIEIDLEIWKNTN